MYARERRNVKPDIFRPVPGKPETFAQKPHFPREVELPNILERRKTPEQLAAEKPAPGVKKAHG